MNKLKYGILILLSVTIFSCKESKKEETTEVKEETVIEKKEPVTMGATKFEKLQGYFVKNTVEFDKAYKFIAVSNQEKFDTYFGIAKTMKNEVSALDFEKYNVAAIIAKPSNTSGKIKMTKYTAEEAKQTVEFTVEKGEDKSFTSGDLLLFKIPKSRTSVDFVSKSATVNVEVK